MFDIEFYNPEFLWLLLIVPPLALFFFKTNKNRTSSFKISSTSDFGIGLKSRIYPVLDILKLLTITMIIIALARPQEISNSVRTKTSSGIDIVIAVDISSSMLAQDLKPNRLEALKSVAAEFINDRKNDRIGLVIYAGESYTKTPVTSDKTIIIKSLNDIVFDGIIQDGTAIGMGLATSVNRLKDSRAKSKVIILLTDGVNTHGKIHPLNATEIAKQFNVRVYTIGVGTNGKAKTPVAIDPYTGRYIYDLVDVEIDEKTLMKIASETGGKYFRATDNNKLKEVYKEINELEKAKIKTIEYDIDLPEKANIFILFGLALLLIEFIISKYFIPSIS